MKKKILFILKIFFTLILFFIIVNGFLNKQIFITKYQIYSEKIPKQFDNYKIVQITDVHSIRNDLQLKRIVNKIKNEEPDIICVTGDLIDSEYYSKQNGLYIKDEIDKIEELTIEFMKELAKISDTYFIYGNHEMMLLDDPENNSFKLNLEEIGVKLFNNSTEAISKNEDNINLIGIQDPATLYKDKKYAYLSATNKERIEIILKDMLAEIPEENKEKFTILLSHRPEYFEIYDKYNIDLALTGHTHGGIVKIPLIGGIYAHPQGWFPEYSYGMYKSDDFSMIVGSGIGYSKLPIRIFNPPEINVITLKNNDKE